MPPRQLYHGLLFANSYACDYDMIPLVKLESVDQEVLTAVCHHLQASGLHVLLSFDSHDVTPFAQTAACPHHGTARCDCRLAILLIYDQAAQPATLLLRGQDRTTWISLASAPGQRPSATLERRLRQLLSSWPGPNSPPPHAGT